MQDYQAASIQSRVSNLLGKDSFDHENQMPDPFAGAELNQQGALLN
jgi:hypothetical protein